MDFTSLNRACHKECFPLPKIGQLVDSTSDHARMRLLDAYPGYHQIVMHEPNQEKTIFITPRGVLCSRVTPFGLKNAGATYQRMIMKMFEPILGKTMDVYINDNENVRAVLHLPCRIKTCHQLGIVEGGGCKVAPNLHC